MLAASRDTFLTRNEINLAGEGWVLKRRLNDIQSWVGAVAARAYVEYPLPTELFVDSCSVRHQGNCCASTREISAI